jgi:hypothetical protein
LAGHALQSASRAGACYLHPGPRRGRGLQAVEPGFSKEPVGWMASHKSQLFAEDHSISSGGSPSSYEGAEGREEEKGNRYFFFETLAVRVGVSAAQRVHHAAKDSVRLLLSDWGSCCGTTAALPKNDGLQSSGLIPLEGGCLPSEWWLHRKCACGGGDTKHHCLR